MTRTPDQLDDLYAAPDWYEDVPEGVRPEPLGLSLRCEGKYVQHGYDPARPNTIAQLVQCGDEVVFYDRDAARYVPIVWKVRVQS